MSNQSPVSNVHFLSVEAYRKALQMCMESIWRQGNSCYNTTSEEASIMLEWGLGTQNSEDLPISSSPKPLTFCHIY